jgi:hypothetical protein
VGPLALGVNVAAWDSTYTGAGVSAINHLLASSGVTLLRYPGGSWADEFDWSNGTDTSKCTGTATTSCTGTDPLGFSLFARHARAIGGSMFATVNYGSGTPSEAAAWVTRANKAKHQAVALWEVGNETYSCYETNHHLADSPTYVTGYTPNGSVCPSTTVMAKSYAADVQPYLAAMKKADPDARIGMPWAFNGDQAQGAGVNDAMLWNTEVLKATKADVSFVDAHWYPYDQVSGVSDQQILLSTRKIPAAAEQIRKTLARDLPGGGFVIGETNISEQPTTLNFQPVSALFAAATSLSWLAQGAESVVWWDLNNFGSPTTGDYGVLSSGGTETGAAGTPLPPYYGELLASTLTTDGSTVGTTPTGSADTLGYRSDLGHQRHVLLINTSSTSTVTVSDRWFASGSTLHLQSYGPSSASTATPAVSSTAKAGASVEVPAGSMVVMTGEPRT